MTNAYLRKLVAAVGFIALATLAQAQTVPPNSKANAIQTPAIPKGKETDIKLYGANGGAVVIGREALEQMPKAGLILWLAGNHCRVGHNLYLLPNSLPDPVRVEEFTEQRRCVACFLVDAHQFGGGRMPTTGP